jgi:hypothetical protein
MIAHSSGRVAPGAFETRPPICYVETIGTTQKGSPMLSDRLIELPWSLYRERELFRKVDYFFDGAIYRTAFGYEQKSSKTVAARRAKAS